MFGQYAHLSLLLIIVLFLSLDYLTLVTFLLIKNVIKNGTLVVGL